MERKTRFWAKAKPRGNTNFITQEPHKEYQCDLFLCPEPRASDKQHKRGMWRIESRLWTKNTDALLVVDIFTKFTQVVPLQSKDIPDVIQGMRECLKLMRRIPQSMYMPLVGWGKVPGPAGWGLQWLVVLLLFSA